MKFWTEGPAMPRTDVHPFAARMMNRPKPASLDSSPEARFFYDPPELIQQVFGGRPWFFEQGVTSVHRVGLFRGLGWTLPLLVQRQDERGINGVRITARKKRRVAEGSEQKYDLEFLRRELPEDHCERGTERVIDHRPGLTIDQLKPAYAEVLGGHAV